MKNYSKLKENKIKRFLFLILFITLILSLSGLLLCSCSSEEKKVTGEQLGEAIKKIDEGVRVSRERVDEFEKLEKENFEAISPFDILELASLDYEYTTEEQTSEDFSMFTADFIDGRRIMIIRFLNPGKVESFYLQFQSNLCNQEYNFDQRLKYSDLCNSFLSKDESTKAYLLKKQNYIIALIK